MKMGSDPLIRVLCVTDDEQLGSLVRETIVTSLPSTLVDVEESQWVQTDALTRAACMVLDSNLQQAAGVDALRRFRAAGFSGAAVLLLTDPAPGVAMRAASLGAPITILKREIPSSLPAAVVAAARTAMSPGEWRSLYDQLRRTQRFNALGQIAARLRHDLGNPMTVILSEAQMLDMDPGLPDRYRESVREIITMCRRVNTIVRDLDGPVEVPSLPSMNAGGESPSD
jgi:signal transduction histidine kinase